MDMRSKFEFTIEGKQYDVVCETWQEALEVFLDSAKDAGFGVDEKRAQAIKELARSGKVSI